MKFDYVKIILTNVDDEFANVKLEFSPELPENEEDIEDQPCLTLLDAMLDSITDEEGLQPGQQEWLQ